MSQTVTQNQAADLIATITDQTGVPALGLTTASVLVEYLKEGGTSFLPFSITNTAATITSGNAETYAFSDGETLTVAVDGGGAQTATFNTADFGNIAAATALEVAAVINTDITGVTASDVGGFVVIASDTTGESSQIQVTGGTGNAALGFSTTAVNGTTPWKEIGSGVYTIEFTASELDTVGSFTFKVTGATIQQFVGIANVVAASSGTQTSTSLSTCVVSGHIKDLSGNPIKGASVRARIVGLPTLLNNSIAITDEIVSVLTDSNGEFILRLARLAVVDITIPKVNYRRTLTVPNSASALLFQIP